MNIIERYVERMMAESTPERPLWNIEKIKEARSTAGITSTAA